MPIGNTRGCVEKDPPGLESRYQDILFVSVPLVLSMAATTVMEFTDRVFLANYDLDAIAAAVPAGIVVFLFISLFSGIAGYLNVFIAQYTGAAIPHRIGACLWQGIYFSLFSGVILWIISHGAEPLFRWGGHDSRVQALEVIYFEIMCAGGGLSVMGAGLSCFFSGRGKTRSVMVVSAIGMIFNIPLDYALINGWWVFPEMGIRGAAIATVASWGLMALIYCGLIFNALHEEQFGVYSQRSLDWELTGRLIRFGVPGALQFCMDILSFTFFIFMVGRIGRVELAVTNIVMSINSLAFMPAMGFSLGLSTLVGQALGRNRPDVALQAAAHTRHLLLAYIFFLDLLFVFCPAALLDLFSSASTHAAEYQRIVETGTHLLRIVAVYVFFDALYMSFVGVLKGAGDTRFIMISIGLTGLLVMVLPIYVGVIYFGTGLYFSWIVASLFIFSLFTVTLWRYRQGRWQTMRVMEKQVNDGALTEGMLPTTGTPWHE